MEHYDLDQGAIYSGDLQLSPTYNFRTPIASSSYCGGVSSNSYIMLSNTATTYQPAITPAMVGDYNIPIVPINAALYARVLQYAARSHHIDAVVVVSNEDGVTANQNSGRKRREKRPKIRQAPLREPTVHKKHKMGRYRKSHR